MPTWVENLIFVCVMAVATLASLAACYVIDEFVLGGG